MTRTVVFCLEEPSAWEMLQAIIPHIFPRSVQFQSIVFQGKSDLDKRLEMRIRGWRLPNTHFVILRDQDSADCKKLKSELTKKATLGGRPKALIRIACHELESFYLGDLKAVESGLQLSGVAKLQSKAKYREPDKLSNAADELFQLSEKKYQKIAGSRAISRYLAIDGSNQSNSFNQLISGLKRIAAATDET